MPAASPSPTQKRPSLAERGSSNHSLSSSGKREPQPKAHKVNRHSRNLSHGKNLSKLGRINSAVNVAADGRNHQRNKSGPSTPGHSPKTPASPHMKRNTSHVTLSKNTSHTNLRKNHSAKELALGRNVSQGNLKKLGAPPLTRKQRDEQKQGFFELGDKSSGGEDEGEWEDSTTTHSPEMSRNQSKASTPLRPRTPNGETQVHQDKMTVPDKIPSPPDAALKSTNTRSTPNLRKPEITAEDQHHPEPTLLQNNPRASKAPPAMSTVSAQVKRNDSSRSISQLSQQDGKSSTMNMSTPTAGTSSSASGGVSHFLPANSVATSRRSLDDDSDDGSPSGFMSHYKPQTPESPEKSRLLNKARIPSLPSRTQQKLELQRRETMRAGGVAPAAASPATIALSAGSSVSLHSRSGSKGRTRSLVGDPKAMRHDFEAGVKQLTVVRRFRNPILDSLHRLQDTQVIPSETSSLTSSAAAPKSRPQSRRGIASGQATPKVGISRSPEDKRNTLPTAPGSQARPSKVQFQLSRQGSHDDIGLTTSQGSPEDFDEDQDGMSPEEALIRRIWEASYVRE